MAQPTHIASFGPVVGVEQEVDHGDKLTSDRDQIKEAGIDRDDVFPLWNSQILANSTEERRHHAFIVMYSLHVGRKPPTGGNNDLRVFPFGHLDEGVRPCDFLFFIFIFFSFFIVQTCTLSKYTCIHVLHNTRRRTRDCKFYFYSFFIIYFCTNNRL